VFTSHQFILELAVNQQMKCPRIRIPKCPLIQNENVPWPPLAMF
jgi:hypothetical protein